MPTTFGSRIKNAWNAFNNKDPTVNAMQYGMSYNSKPDRVHLSLGNERSIIAALYNRIAIDVACINIRHVRADQNGKYVEEIQDYLNDCLTLSANLDQTARAFIQDAVLTLFDDGCVALVPVEASEDPDETGSYDVYQLRVGRIREWYPQRVKLDVYDQRTGRHREVIMRKDSVAIIENPLYTVMNEPNSTLRRLVRKMNLLDGVDEQTSSGKLDIIIQLPYSVKTEAMMKRAEQRRKDIEDQLAGSKYGIAYIDGTERVTQLNRAAENNLLSQIEYLTKVVFNQLGVTEAVFYGEANEQEMLNYHNRTIEPIVSAFCDGMTRSFLSRTARTQGQRVMFFRDPFKLVPVNQIADIADKFTRNEVLSSNEVRAIVGYKPVDDARADELRNKNLNTSKEEPAGSGPIAGDGENEPLEQSALEHHGVKNQKWGVRNGPPYPLDQDRSSTKTHLTISQQKKMLNDLNKDLNSWDYSVLIDGKPVALKDADFSKYKTTPISDLEKHRAGVCWDFVNYQHAKFKEQGIKDSTYMFVAQRSKDSNDIVTHTFSIVEIGDKKYWFESSWLRNQGIHEVESYKDVINKLNDTYKTKSAYDVYSFNPDGMDKGLTNGEYFDKATQNLIESVDKRKKE